MKANANNRDRTAIETFRCARESIGTLSASCSCFGLTRGQFSMIDLILACLDQSGPAHVTLWTWCIAEYEVQCFQRLMLDRRITSALLVIDTSARNKNRHLIRAWQEHFGPASVRWVCNHAKIATIETADWRLLVRGSMNLNYNPRFEQFDIDEGHPGFDVVRQAESELPVLPMEHSEADVRAASQIQMAFSTEQLIPFTTATKKIWAK